MLPNAWRNFQILVYLTFIPTIMAKILPLSRTMLEILINLGLMGFMLVFIHGLRIVFSILRTTKGVDPRISEATSGLYDMEASYEG
jgi:sensor histidine kinase YesM